MGRIKGHALSLFALPIQAYVIHERLGSDCLCSSALARVRECLLTISPLFKPYFVRTSPSPPKWTSPCSQDIFFFIFMHPLVSLAHATFFFALFRKLTIVQPPQLGRVNMHCSELSSTAIDTDGIQGKHWLSIQRFDHWSLFLFSQIQVTFSCSFLYK